MNERSVCGTVTLTPGGELPSRALSAGELEREQASAMALAHLSHMHPPRQTALLQTMAPSAAWELICSGASDVGVVLRTHRARVSVEVLHQWQHQAASIDVPALGDRLRRAGISVVARGLPGYPAALLADPDPPGVLFARGNPAMLCRPMVAIVGTREATASGKRVAYQLGHDAAAAGIAVASGLALGIDGAAHSGALASPTPVVVGVVGCGVDVVYPRRHAQLWQDVVSAGVIVSEYPPGTRPAPERFPARNRILASLANVVVVVESHAKGGSLNTAKLAHDRLRTVLAVPGNIGEAASVGSNELLRTCAPCTGVADIAAAVNWSLVTRDRIDPRPVPSEMGSLVLAALGWDLLSVDFLTSAVGCTLVGVVRELAVLELSGWVARDSGKWRRLAVAP